MDPMDYILNHPSSSEEPYADIPASSVPPQWMSHGSASDAGGSHEALYVPRLPSLPLPFPYDPLAYANADQYQFSQNGTFPWHSVSTYSSAPYDHALSHSNSPMSATTRDRPPQITRDQTQASQSWSNTETAVGPTTSDRRDAQRLPISNTAMCPTNTSGCSNNQDIAAALLSASGAESSSPLTTMISSRAQRWTREEEGRNFPARLPPLRGQVFVHSTGAEDMSALPSFHQNFGSSPDSSLRSARSIYAQNMSHSPAVPRETPLPRLDEASIPSPVSPSSSAARGREQQTVSRSHPSSRAHMLPVQRPASVSFDSGRTSTLPTAVLPTGATPSGPPMSPRRQRTSAPRRHIPSSHRPSRSRSHDGLVDRAMVREFLASQNLGPDTRISPNTYATLEELLYRNLQVLQGTKGPARIARTSIINSLPSVPIQDLPEDERACTICYSSYGVETPEGITERPLRWPGCKHVFGSHCLTTWLEDSDKCPYCRNKLRSESKWFVSAAKAYLIGLKGYYPEISAAMDNETYLSAARGYDQGGFLQETSSPPTTRTPSSMSRRTLSLDRQPDWAQQPGQDLLMSPNDPNPPPTTARSTFPQEATSLSTAGV